MAKQNGARESISTEMTTKQNKDAKESMRHRLTVDYTDATREQMALTSLYHLKVEVQKEVRKGTYGKSGEIKIKLVDYVPGVTRTVSRPPTAEEMAEFLKTPEGQAMLEEARRSA